MNKEKCCLCCRADEETLLHLFQCKDPQMEKTRTESIAIMKKILQSTNVPKQVAGPFLEMVHSLSTDKDITVTCHTCPMVAEAIEDQRQIGKYLMLRVFLSSKWHHAIKHHTKVQTNSKSALLVSSLWKTYFFPIWNQRNLLLHKEGSYNENMRH